MRRIILIGTILLAGCGGGGGSSNSGSGSGASGGAGSGGSGSGGSGSGGGSQTQSYTVGGHVSGLSGSGLVLQDNGSDALSVSANGTFVFTTSIASGATFNATVQAQPAGPIQVCAVTNATGAVGSANIANIEVSCGPIGLLAGALGGSGFSDGQGVAARFNEPFGMATDAAGNVYVADLYNQTIRKITPTGLVSTLAGLAGQGGSTDGTGSGALFQGPAGLATDTAGNVYVADSGNYTIRKITPAGVVSTIAGVAGQIGSADGTGSAARFNFPYSIAIDSAGNLYVADTSNQTIRMITPAGAVSTLAGLAGKTGTADGTGGTARFGYPQGVATDSAGNVYVADTTNDTIRKITSAGVVTTVAGSAAQSGTTDGTGSAARFTSPMGLAIDSADNIYVADGGASTIRKITPAGVVTTLAGMAGKSGSADGVGSAAQFNYPEGIALDATGSLYVADTTSNTIRKISAAAAVTTLAGSVAQVGSVDGTGSAARFNKVNGIATDSAGNAYVADSGNQTIRKITRAGVVSLFAGTNGLSYGGFADGGPGTAMFRSPGGVASDSAGNIYVADTYNEAIRKITPDGVVSTLAGSGSGIPGSADGTGAAAQFNNPTGIATDAAGNIYVADSSNFTIRKITQAGVVTTFSGTAGVTGSADGSHALFGSPLGIAVDTAGNAYVADTGNQTIRRITSAGIVTTVAGTAGESGSADGAGGAARFNQPSGLAIDTSGNVYVADGNNNTIRLMTPDGTVTTIVGTPGSQGVNLGPLPGSLNAPRYLALLPGTGVTLLETGAENAILEINVP
jgi:sugar lactone lactonase YvrE